MLRGTCKKWNATYGWITLDGGGGDLFVHHEAIDVPGYRELHQGDRVEIDGIEEGPRGKRATRVRKIDQAARNPDLAADDGGNWR